MSAKSQKSTVKALSHGRNQSNQTPFSGLKWFLVAVLLVGGIVANTYFGTVAWAVRAAVGIIIFVAALGVASQTTSGQTALAFIKAARGEIRKVVWPTRQETVQTTLIVVAMVVFSALVLWGLDNLFFRLVGWLAGQRG